MRQRSTARKKRTPAPTILKWLAAVMLLLCPACFNGPDVAVELVSNDLGAYFAVRVHNTGSSEIEMQGVRVNDFPEVDKYMLGFFEDFGTFPMRLAPGQNILVLNPVPWGDPTETVEVRADGMQSTFTF